MVSKLRKGAKMVDRDDLEGTDEREDRGESERAIEDSKSSPIRLKLSLGWIGVIVSTAIACFWAFWGIIENFHEGWYFESIWLNLQLMFGQYLSFMLAFLALGAVSITWPRVGSVLHVALAIWALWFFSFASAVKYFVALPIVLMAVAYWNGHPYPRKWAYSVLFGATLITLVACGVEPAWRIWIVGRTNDGNFGARIVEGNGVKLVWAPAGPGWPNEGIKWDEAVRRCQYLTEDGLQLADKPQNIWRLPTADEVVRSMHRHGKPCGGTWDGKSPFPNYRVMPDKETPLWNVHWQVIYMWTGTEIDDDRAYSYCYNGQVRSRRKNFAPAYFSFRAVKDVPKP